MALNPKIWGPHYWFVLHTIALNYPLHPNETSKKKYYDFFENFSLFIPISDMGNLFNQLLDNYPVTPYLDSRESLIKWIHFIHNKINKIIGVPEKSLEESLHNYYKFYESQEIKSKEKAINKEKIIYLCFIALLISICIYLKIYY